MAKSINPNFPVQTTLRLTEDQRDRLQADAARRGIPVRALLRFLIDNHLNATHAIYSVTPEMRHDLSVVARHLDTTPEERIARYIATGIAIDCAKYGIDPTKED